MDSEVVEDVEIVDAVGMLPRPNGVEIKEADEDLALHLANHLYPHLTHIDQITDRQEKAWWVLISTQVLRGHEAVKRYVEDFSKVFQPGVEAQVNESLKRSAGEESEREERRALDLDLHKANLLRIAQQETLDQKRWDLEEKERNVRLGLDEVERTTKLRLETEEWESQRRRSDRREDLAHGMAAITFLCAFGAFIVGLLSGQAWIIGGSTITGVASLIAVVKLMSSTPRHPMSPAPAPSGSSEGGT